MKTTRAIAIMVTFMIAGLVSAAKADRMVDPDTLSPKDREFALHGPIGQYDPWGQPTTPSCRWSRIQIQTSQGLKWVALEECQLNFSR